MVEHSGEPGTEALDLEQLLGAGKELDQYVLDEVLGVGHAAGEAPGQPIEVLDLRAQQILEIQLRRPGAAVRRRGGPGSAERRNRGHNLDYTSARPKRFPAQPARGEFVLLFPAPGSRSKRFPRSQHPENRETGHRRQNVLEGMAAEQISGESEEFPIIDLRNLRKRVPAEGREEQRAARVSGAEQDDDQRDGEQSNQLNPEIEPQVAESAPVKHAAEAQQQ